MINLVMYDFVYYRRILLQLVLILLYMTRENKVLLEVPLQGNMDFCMSALYSARTVLLACLITCPIDPLVTLLIMVLNN